MSVQNQNLVYISLNFRVTIYQWILVFIYKSGAFNFILLAALSQITGSHHGTALQRCSVLASNQQAAQSDSICCPPEPLQSHISLSKQCYLKPADQMNVLAKGGLLQTGLTAHCSSTAQPV